MGSNEVPKAVEAGMVQPDFREDGDEEPEMTADGKKIHKRETWSRPIDFVLACIGFSVGLGNVWRFPYLCYKNGGGAFLIPYFVCLLIGGVPLFFLEVCVGQYMQAAGVKAWELAPLFKGIGIATTIIIFFLNCYYNIILTWAFYYVFASFTAVLPWSHCNNEWNTEACTTDFNRSNFNTTLYNGTLMDPVTEFWERKVLAISGGITEVGTVKWDLALTMVFAWLVIFACICKGIKSSGKVMYVTATSPYIFMLILMIRGALLPGAVEGLKYYFIPNFSRLLDMQVWVDAGSQVFFSMSIALGTLTALGSFNKFNHNSYRDTIIFACANSGTSLFAGTVIFMVLGFMAQEQGVTVDKVAASGPGLAFIAYPKAIAQMPVAPLWSVFFFIMVILLGLDSQFVGVEGFVTSIVDTWPHILRVGHRKVVFIALSCGVMCLVGLSMVTNGGMYVFQLFDYYSGGRIILLIGFFECIVVAWVYGVNRFYDNIEMMLGFRINPFMKIMWVAVSPLYCIVIFIMSLISYSELSYETTRGVYQYPQWAVGVGWSMAFFSIIWIPIYMLYSIIVNTNFIQSAKRLVKPNLKPHQLRPQDMWELEDRPLDGSSIEDKVPDTDATITNNYDGYPNAAFVQEHTKF